MSYLNTPLQTGKLKLKNRLVMPPMATSKSPEDGAVSPELLAYYKEKSQGGYLSLIIIEHSFITPQGKAHKAQLSVAEDRHVEQLRKLADVIHQNGSKVVMQINHAGSNTTTEETGLPIVAPSAVPNPSKPNAQMPQELTTEQIQQIVQDFAQAAVRVKQAGFDGVEIHSAHGYLLNQFMSPLTNKREDAYGGDIYARSKIHLEIIEAVRKAVGADFPILMRLGAADYMEGGLTLEDSLLAAKTFEEAGLDLLDISGGMCRFILPGVTEAGYFAPLSSAMKEALSIPVILTGGVTKPEEAEQLLIAHKADLIGVGRAIFKDSFWAKNAMKELI